jgi:Winged helix DNA-binding domain
VGGVSVLTRRVLNRTLLLRQGLLERGDPPVVETVERLVGLQAQVPRDPYVGLWARLRDFDPEALSALLSERRVVRAGLMRSTIHLVSARDCLVMAPLTAALRARTFHSPFGAGLRGADPAPIVAAARELLEAGPRTRAELASRLGERWPDVDRDSLGALVTLHLPLVQIPPRGLWRGSGQPTWALAEAWLDAPLEPDPSPADLVLRYLAAFGPATPADVRTWCGITGLRDVIDRLRPRLATYRDESGRELLDVPDGPLADPETPAPPRLLPEFDNALLSHADRSRIVGDSGLPPARAGGWSPVLVDGFLRSHWRLTDGEIVLDPPLHDEAVLAEAAALARFLAV